MSLTNRWVIFFLLLPHISIYYFSLEPVKSVIFVWQLVVVLLALFLIFRLRNSFSMLLIFYTVVVALSAVSNGTLSSGVFFTILSFIGYCIYISYATRNPKELIKGLFYLFSFIAIVNFLTMLRPEGIATSWDGYPIYLLGGKNAIQMIMLPTIAIACIYSYFFYKKLRLFPLFIVLISISAMYLSDSGTGVVLSMLSLVFIVFLRKVSPSFNTFLALYIIIFFGIVIFRLQEVLFGNFIVNVLHKDVTFTGRTYIWDFVLESLKQSWLLGVGRGNTLISKYFLNLNETHNGTLEVLMFSGAIGMAVFLIILLVVGKRLKKTKKNTLSKILSFSIFAYMIIGLTESVFYKKEYWLLLILAYGIERIVEKSNEVVCADKVKSTFRRITVLG